jgi:hypothetical protein
MKSRDNARRLYEDAGSDTLDLFAAFKAWGENTAQSTDWLDAFTNAGQDLSQRAALVGIETLDGSYKRVTDASTECAIENHYALSFKMLSKFAHPTAMQILALAMTKGISSKEICSSAKVVSSSLVPSLNLNGW